MPECRNFRVQGRVQGVFFRASALQRAEELGLAGWVRNCADGSVEGVACGDSEALDAFAAWLWQGPDRARVSQVELTPAQVTPPARFEIR